MGKPEDNNVDAATKLAIVSAIEEKLNNFSVDIKAHIDLKINPIEKDVNRLINDVDDLYEKDRDMRDRVGTLEQRQSKDEGIRTGQSGEHKKVELSYRKITVIVAIFSAISGLLCGLIVYFI